MKEMSFSGRGNAPDSTPKTPGPQITASSSATITCPTICYQGLLRKSHSYGIVATELSLALERKGFNLKMFDLYHEAAWDADRLDPRLQNMLSADMESDLVLSYCPPSALSKLPQGRMALIYNYEFTELPQGWANEINNRANLFLPSSDFSKAIFIKNGVNPAITEVLHHGVDIQQFNPQVAPLAIDSKNFIFLCVATPHARKGLEVLLRAFGEEFTASEDVELIIKTHIPQKPLNYEVDVRVLL